MLSAGAVMLSAGAVVLSGGAMIVRTVSCAAGTTGAASDAVAHDLFDLGGARRPCRTRTRAGPAANRRNASQHIVPFFRLHRIPQHHAVDVPERVRRLGRELAVGIVVHDLLVARDRLLGVAELQQLDFRHGEVRSAIASGLSSPSVSCRRSHARCRPRARWPLPRSRIPSRRAALPGSTSARSSGCPCFRRESPAGSRPRRRTAARIVGHALVEVMARVVESAPANARPRRISMGGSLSGPGLVVITFSSVTSARSNWPSSIVTGSSPSTRRNASLSECASGRAVRTRQGSPCRVPSPPGWPPCRSGCGSGTRSVRGPFRGAEELGHRVVGQAQVHEAGAQEIEGFRTVVAAAMRVDKMGERGDGRIGVVLGLDQRLALRGVGLFLEIGLRVAVRERVERGHALVVACSANSDFPISSMASSRACCPGSAQSRACTW